MKRLSLFSLSALSLVLGAIPGPAAAEPPIGIAPIPSPPEEVAEYLRLEKIAAAWAEQLARRYGLSGAQCSIGLSSTERSGCGFSIDGVELILWKEGRAPTVRNIGAIPQFFNRVDRIGPGQKIIGGKWIRVGDLIEIDVGTGIHAFDCYALGEADYVSAQCTWAQDWPSIASRASGPAARYRFDTDEEVELGRGFATGRVHALHNGKPLSLTPLVEAARAFARADLEALAR
jgi:hypothetical protein